MMVTLVKFAGKVAYDAACITVGSFVLWGNELKDLHVRGWFDPQASFEAVSLTEMDHG